MSKKEKEKLVIEKGVLPGKATLPPGQFGELLIKMKDLDPIYDMMYSAGMDLDFKKRWMLAYSCFYHAGVAAYIAEDPKRFWKRLRKGHDDKWPRGSERRHFRGGTSDFVTNWLPQNFKSPEAAIDFIIGPNKERTFQTVSKRVQSWKYFGSWIAFKMADLVDRVLLIDVDFSDCHLDLYDSPKQGAEMIAAYMGTPDIAMDKLVSKMEKRFSHLKAGPDYKRPIGVQEVETVFCKWKSHCSGHYPPGKDIMEIREGLEGWGDTAHHLELHLPKLKTETKKGKT